MSRLGVFGGSFDPPHRAHRTVAEAALKQLGLDAVVWIPARRPPHKPSRDLAPAEHRVEMVKLAILGEPRFRVDTRELHREGPSYTVDTLESLHIEDPDAELFLIVGADNLEGFSSWRNPERIRELARLVVYRRPGCVVEPIPDMVELSGVEWDDSSTEARHRIRTGAPWDEILDPLVGSYIRTHGLYLPA